MEFVHIASRRAFVAGINANPAQSGWHSRRGMPRCRWPRGGLPATHLLIDYDSKFPRSFDAVFTDNGTEVKRVGPRAPNLNSVIERFLQSVRRESLDRFVVCGERHFRHLFREYLEHYNSERPHQAKGNVTLPDADRDEPPVVPFPSGEVKCRKRLGGLLRHYYRATA